MPERLGRPAAFFDLDKTILAKSSALAFSKPLYNEGLLSTRSVLRSAIGQLLFATQGADHQRLEKMRDEIAATVAGWDVEIVRQTINDALGKVIDPMIHAEALELIADHQRRGHDVIILSASGAEMVRPIGRALGVDHVIATEMEIEDGRFTGEITFFAHGPNKALAMEELAREKGYDLSASWAYTDSITDLAMLEAVGHPRVVNPDKALRTVALERDWPISEFRRPVALTPRTIERTPVRIGLAAAAVGTLAVAGVVARNAIRRDLGSKSTS